MREKVMGERDSVTPKASLGSLWTTAYLKAFVRGCGGWWVVLRLSIRLVLCASQCDIVKK